MLPHYLFHIGLDQKSCNWFCNYLTNRTYCVVADDISLISICILIDQLVPHFSFPFAKSVIIYTALWSRVVAKLICHVV